MANFEISARAALSLGGGCVAACIAFASLAVPADPGAIEGRWKAQSSEMIVDIDKCGPKYCGQIVKAAKQCGGTILTITRRKVDENGSPTFDGNLKLPDESRELTAKVFVAQPENAGGPPQLMIEGMDPKIGFETRALPFEDIFVRTGPSTCRPGVVG